MKKEELKKIKSYYKGMMDEDVYNGTAENINKKIKDLEEKNEKSENSLMSKLAELTEEEVLILFDYRGLLQ